MPVDQKWRRGKSVSLDLEDEMDLIAESELMGESNGRLKVSFLLLYYCPLLTVAVTTKILTRD